jgi:hypothetical protein
MEIFFSVNSKKLLKIQKNLLNFGKPKTGKKWLINELIKKIENTLRVMPHNNQDKMWRGLLSFSLFGLLRALG